MDCLRWIRAERSARMALIPRSMRVGFRAALEILAKPTPCCVRDRHEPAGRDDIRCNDAFTLGKA